MITTLALEATLSFFFGIAKFLAGIIQAYPCAATSYVWVFIEEGVVVVRLIVKSEGETYFYTYNLTNAHADTHLSLQTPQVRMCITHTGYW